MGKSTKSKSIMILLAAITVIVCLVLFIRLVADGYSFWARGATSYEVTGQVGDFIGGVIGTLFSFAAFYMMYLTLEEQREEHDDDKKAQGKKDREHYEDKVEGRFFTLLEFHRQNVEKMSFDASFFYRDSDTTSLSNTVYHGNQVFLAVVNQFISCRNELKFLFSDISSIYEDSYLSEVKRIFPKRKDDFYRHLSVIDICYCVVLFGVSSQGKTILNNLFKGKYRSSLIDDLLSFISLKPATGKNAVSQWKLLESIGDGRRKTEIVSAIKEFRNGQSYKGKHMINTDYDLAKNYARAFSIYYSGHQFHLGHYFRHLYQIVCFIDGQKELDDSEKYRFIKILRAQLSDYEQIVLFLNSLSQVGKKWEICSDSHKNLITSYHLIKNIPFGSLYDLKPDYYYPKVNYEFKGN